MARFRYYLKKWFDQVPDWLWPHLTGEPHSPSSDEPELSPCDESLLNDVEHILGKRMAQVDERLRNVETKLLALLTLTSVLSAAITATFTVALNMNIPDDFPHVLFWLILILVFYITINLLRSLWATVSGLIRRGYKQLHWKEIVPREREDSKSYKMRILTQQIDHIKWNEWVIDDKVSQMAVAHEALRNALAATGGIILVALVTSIIRILK